MQENISSQTTHTLFVPITLFTFSVNSLLYCLKVLLKFCEFVEPLNHNEYTESFVLDKWRNESCKSN